MWRPEQFAGYDRSTILFSPDGRIIQVEYARKAMQRGTISIGLVARDAVVLLGRRKMDILVLPNKKVYQVDDHIGAVFSGYSADGRTLINYARERAQVYRYVYGEPIDVELLGYEVAEMMHQYTQYGGARPFGCGLILGGVDIVGPKVVYIDPGGALMRWIAGAIGANKDRAEKFFRDYVEKNGGKLDVDLKEAIMLGLAGVLLATSLDIKPEEIEIGYVKKGEKFVIKTAKDPEILPLLQEAKKKAGEWKGKAGEEEASEETSEEGMI
ncbi:MAG: archaeal proteasome endopeptidase complex subunit alpha [Candidatus Njordarchaeales archaeon]